VLVNLGKRLKLVFTYIFLCAGKPRKNDEIRITYLFLCAGKLRYNDDIRIHLHVPVSCGLGNLGKIMKLGFTYLLLCAVRCQTYE
jgi:hypothetical protein